MNKLLKLFFYLYVLSLPFTSAFSVSGSIFPPFIIAVILAPLVFLSTFNGPLQGKSYASSEVFFLLFFIILVWISYFVNGFESNKSLNHSFAYTLSILVYYLSMKAVFIQLNTGRNFISQVLKLLTITLGVSAFYACLEFVSRNFLSIDIGEFVPRGDLPEYDAIVAELFQRARGFAVESGHFTFMVEILAPVVFYYLFYSGLCKWHSLLKYSIVTLIIASIIFAASSATFIIVPVVLCITGVIYFRKLQAYFLRNRRRVYLTTGFLALLVLALNRYFSLYFYIVSSVADKFSSSSYDERESRYNFFFDNFPKQDLVQKMIGVGPSGFRLLGYDENTSIISFYLNVTFEVGIIGLLLLFMFIGIVFLRCLRWKSAMAPFVFAGILGGAFHYYLIGNYYYPWFWFLCIFPFVLDVEPISAKDRDKGLSLAVGGIQ